MAIDGVVLKSKLTSQCRIAVERIILRDFNVTKENLKLALDLFNKRRPCKPFTIVLNSGERLQADHSEALFHSDSAGFFFTPGDAPILFDHDGITNVVGDLVEKESYRFQSR